MDGPPGHYPSDGSRDPPDAVVLGVSGRELRHDMPMTDLAELITLLDHDHGTQPISTHSQNRQNNLGYGPNAVFIPRVDDPSKPHETWYLEVPKENLASADPWAMADRELAAAELAAARMAAARGHPGPNERAPVTHDSSGGKPAPEESEQPPPLPFEAPPDTTDRDQYQMQLSASDEERMLSEQVATQEQETAEVKRLSKQLAKDHPEKAVPLLRSDQRENGPVQTTGWTGSATPESERRTTHGVAKALPLRMHAWKCRPAVKQHEFGRAREDGEADEVSNVPGRSALERSKTAHQQQRRYLRSTATVSLGAAPAYTSDIAIRAAQARAKYSGLPPNVTTRQPGKPARWLRRTEAPKPVYETTAGGPPLRDVKQPDSDPAGDHGRMQREMGGGAKKTQTSHYPQEDATFEGLSNIHYQPNPGSAPETNMRQSLGTAGSSDGYLRAGNTEGGPAAETRTASKGNRHWKSRREARRFADDHEAELLASLEAQEDRLNLKSAKLSGGATNAPIRDKRQRGYQEKHSDYEAELRAALAAQEERLNRGNARPDEHAAKGPSDRRHHAKHSAPPYSPDETGRERHPDDQCINAPGRKPKRTSGLVRCLRRYRRSKKARRTVRPEEETVVCT